MGVSILPGAHLLYADNAEDSPTSARLLSPITPAVRDRLRLCNEYEFINDKRERLPDPPGASYHAEVLL
jgi:hypothetical protein